MLIGIIPNLDIKDTAETAAILAEKLKANDIEAYVLNNNFKSNSVDENVNNTDMIISIGGDGTYLHTARYAVERNIPVLGMNMGRLGFLTQFDYDGMDKAAELLKEGKYTIEERFLEDIKVQRKGQTVYNDFALNDLVVHRDSVKLIDIELHIDESYVSSFYGDGLIIAAPTGSTAYSLSAGGPIVEPESEVMLITPICPHSISSRPMVVSGNRVIRVKLKEGAGLPAIITVDGGEGIIFTSEDEIMVKRSEKRAKVVKLYQTDFYKILREKFL